MCDGSQDTRLDKVEAQVRDLAKGCEEIEAGLRTLLPIMPGLCEALQTFAAILRGEVPMESIRAKSIVIVNDAGERAVTITADGAGEGHISVWNDAGQVVACLSADDDGGGSVQIHDSRGRPVAGLQMVGGAGTMTLVRPDAEKVIALAPAEASDPVGEGPGKPCS